MITRHVWLLAALTGVADATVPTGFTLPAGLSATGKAITPKKGERYIDLAAFVTAASRLTRTSVQSPHPLVRELIWYPGRANLDRPQDPNWNVPAGPDNLMLQFVAGSGTLHVRQWVNARGETRVAGLEALMAPPFMNGKVMYVPVDVLYTLKCSLLQKKGFAVCPTEQGEITVPVTIKTF
ncbi:hypothetical protein LAJ19_16305 (plasmid) [Deinococcus taeanensis]|uniref:hypothetical protein n=1 Tax=Deinococcus taeanensis TaxID=2737050 RepID=UPI001CDBF62C|nr:hypothetical protein [Deinococcus taeanensis]UBV44718.1 hypothetical protein LAJ19_16305 [Deinococcus taeanensis]